MKIYSDKYLFRAVLFFLAALVCFLKGWTGPEQDRLLLGNWLQCGFFLFLGLQALLTALWKKQARAVLIRENDDWEKRKRLKVYRATIWSAVILLLVVGVPLSLWGGSYEISQFGMGLYPSGLLIFFLSYILEGWYRWICVSES